MSDVHVLAIDLAKRSFQVCGTGRGGSIQSHAVAGEADAAAGRAATIGGISLSASDMMSDWSRLFM